MENEDVIRDQMEDTRTSLTDKLETLEKQVANTVTDATTNVTETVEAVRDSVQDTVSSVKDTVQETISAVKESMHQGVEAVKDFFDLPSHVDHHPWAMVGGSVVLGYVVGAFVGRPAISRYESARSAPQPSSSRAHANGRSQGPSAPPAPGWLGMFGPEIGKLKNVALSSLMGAVSEMIHKSVPPDLGSSLEGIIASITEKLTGGAAQPPKSETDSYPHHREAVVGD